MKSIENFKNLAARQAVQEAEALSLWIKLGGGAILLAIGIHFATGMGEAVASTHENTTSRAQEMEEMWNDILPTKKP